MLVLLVDVYLPFSVASSRCRGCRRYRPLPTALGVVGAELLLALALTNRFRDRLPYAFWRRAHFLNFAVWALALAHGVTAGADGDTAWALSLYAGLRRRSSAAATVWRALRARPLPGWALGLWTGTAGSSAPNSSLRSSSVPWGRDELAPKLNEGSSDADPHLHPTLDPFFSAETAAWYLDLPVGYLLTELADGKTLEGLCGSAARPAAPLVDVLTKGAVELFEEEVDGYELTADHRHAIETHLRERMTALVVGPAGLGRAA